LLSDDDDDDDDGEQRGQRRQKGNAEDVPVENSEELPLLMQLWELGYSQAIKRN